MRAPAQIDTLSFTVRAATRKPEAEQMPTRITGNTATPRWPPCLFESTCILHAEFRHGDQNKLQWKL